MIILNQPNDIVKHLVPGTVLWRSTGISGARYGGGESASLHDVPFEKTDRGSYMARVNFPGQWKPEPEVWFTDEPRVRQRGLVVFIKQLPPSNWLYPLAARKPLHRCDASPVSEGVSRPAND